MVLEKHSTRFTKSQLLPYSAIRRRRPFSFFAWYYYIAKLREASVCGNSPHNAMNAVFGYSGLL